MCAKEIFRAVLWHFLAHSSIFLDIFVYELCVQSFFTGRVVVMFMIPLKTSRYYLSKSALRDIIWDAQQITVYTFYNVVTDLQIVIIPSPSRTLNFWSLLVGSENLM